ncbi:Protein of unknown function [Draconibacterium orientale]|uniref:DNA-binding protein n=1 Tax=Draconibacterium orientale TaxID=1168034 RepID=X5DH86_9BACT|nr:DUF3276 family protein [Draconibacterium orientale]AHW60459.1 DNA-binding protein [Draconibacterium orientale]SEU13508.1 Protein of unknown function [Draconibacterium orientale]
MESGDIKEGAKFKDSKFKQEIHSKVIRAGKRTYFFDVKSTRNDEYYLTITESKKRFGENGKFSYEKHKIFLYREDFTKFIESLQEVVDFIHGKQPEELREEVEPVAETEEVGEEEKVPVKDYTDVEFEDI